MPGAEPFAQVRAAHLDALGDLVERHLDTAALGALIKRGAPADLPTIETEVRGVAALCDDR